MGQQSLENYRNNMPKTFTTSGSPANDFNRNHEATTTKNAGWKGGIFDYAGKNYSYVGLPTTSWTNANGYNSSNSVNTAMKLNNVLNIFSMIIGLVTTGIQVVNVFKSSKKDKTEDNSDSSHLSNLTEQAENCKRKDRAEVASKLHDAIRETNNSIADAKRTQESKKRTKANCAINIEKYTKEKNTAEANVQKFKNEKTALVNRKSEARTALNSLKEQLASTTDDTAKAEIQKQIIAKEAEIKEIEKTIEENYSEADLKELQDIVTTAEDNISKEKAKEKALENEIKELEDQIQQQTSEVKKAEATVKKLDAKLNKED